MKIKKMTFSKRSLLLLGLALITLSACNEQPKKESEEKMDTQTEEEIVAPKEIISLESAKSIYDNYSKFRAPVIKSFETQERSPDETFEVARFVSFDFETVKQYIAYVEQESKKVGVKPNGLRFYFANYPDKERFSDGKKVIHPRQNSIFVLPTLKEGNDDWGYYIGDDGKAKLIKDWVKTNELDKNGADKSKASFMPNFNANLMQGGGSLVMNRSGSGPPPHGDF